MDFFEQEQADQQILEEFVTRPKWAVPVEHLSPSSLNTFMRCQSASIGSRKVKQVVIGTHMTQQRATELAATKKQELLNALVDTAEAFLKPFPPAKE